MLMSRLWLIHNCALDLWDVRSCFCTLWARCGDERNGPPAVVWWRYAPVLFQCQRALQLRLAKGREGPCARIKRTPSLQLAIEDSAFSLLLCRCGLTRRFLRAGRLMAYR